MKKIKITADRCIDLPIEELDAREISTMSCYINMGGKSYEDMIDITPEEILAHYKATGEVAKTAAKSPEQYYEFFKQFTDKGMPVIHLAASKGVSAICGFAIEASKRFDNVYVVDTRSLSGGVALLSRYIEDLMAEGETDPQKIAEACEKQRDKIHDSFLIDSMEFIRKAGRCTGLTFLLANLLKIKPVIMVDKESGLMRPSEKFRGNSRKVIAEYVKSTFTKFPNPDLKRIYVVQSTPDEEMLQYFKDTIAQYHKFEIVQPTVTGCNCFVHAGTNVFGVFFFSK